MRRIFRLPRADRSHHERDIEEEIRFHLERKVEALTAEGLPKDEAEAEALRRFGNATRIKREMRTMARRREIRRRPGQWGDRLAQDLSFAFRQLLKAPAFTAVALVTLGLGIGANTAIFSVVDGILFRPLPYPQPDELVNLWTDVTRRGGPDDEWLSYANFDDIRREVGGLGAVAAWSGWGPVLTARGEAEQLLGAQITGGMFSRVLRITPAMGRHFEEGDFEPGAPGTAILSDGLWRSAFGGDPSAVGSTLVLNDLTYTVVGVMPAGFHPPFISGAQLWVPDQTDVMAVQSRRGGFSWRAVGRLAPGTTLAQAQAELAEVGRRLEATFPESNTGMAFRIVPLRDDIVSVARTGLLVLMAAVAFVLLVACVNVANLLLARSTARRSELAVRSAMGAGRGRVLEQLLTESLVLALLGGVLGVAIAYVGTELLVSLAPRDTPRIEDVTVDGRVLGVTAAVTLLAGVFFGLVPALRASRSNLGEALREGGRGQGAAVRGIRMRNVLVSGQVALALVLLVGAGLLIRSFQNLRTEDLGFRPDGIVTMQINLPVSRYPDSDARRIFYEDLETSLAALPGVSSVAFTNTVPLTGFDGDVDFQVEGRPAAEPGQEAAAWFRRVTPGYFETMGIDLAAGRTFTGSDNEDAQRVVIVNQTLAAREFPGERAVGKRINVNSPEEPVWREIVGVVRDIRNFGIREESRLAMYAPYAQVPTGFVFPVIHTALAPEVIVPSVRRAVATIDPGLAVARVSTMSDIVRDSISADRFVATLTSLFAAVGLLLAVVGLYGVVSYSVSARVRELGVRIALGAAGGDIRTLVLGRSMGLVAIGLTAGLIAAGALTRLMGGLLYGVSVTDPVTFVLVALLLGGCAVLASLAPARRAMKVDPVEVLTSE